MLPDEFREGPRDAWTFRKAVTALAIIPQNASLTRTGRMAFNVMLWLAQREAPSAEGWWSAPVSRIVKGMGSTTRDSMRVKDNIDAMVSTLVRYSPLSASDAAAFAASQPLSAQATLDGVEAALAPSDPFDGARTFTLISEARFSRRSGEAWVEWCFPPTVREMLVDPVRWAQLDLAELASLSRYSAVALYEIVARYRNVPGGLTNRATTDWWMATLRHDSREQTREWRKVKNELIKPAMAEINQRTGLEVRMIEHKAGRAVSHVQFHVRQRAHVAPPEMPDMSLAGRGAGLGLKEREVDAMIDEFGQDAVGKALDALEGRMRLQMREKVGRPLAYLKRILKNDGSGDILDQATPPEATPLRRATKAGKSSEQADRAADDVGTSSLSDDDASEARIRRRNAQLDAMSPEDLEQLAGEAYELTKRKGTLTANLQRRWDAGQYSSPLLRSALREALAARETSHRGESAESLAQVRS